LYNIDNFYCLSECGLNKLQVVLQEQQQSLQSTGDFLALTRANEWSLAGRFSFQVKHQASNSQTNVTVLDTGLITFEPVELQTSTKDIVLSSAVHGNETAPIEICAELIKKLILGELACAELLLIFLNVLLKKI
jgi:succinylglutamate desuccinylase